MAVSKKGTLVAASSAGAGFGVLITVAAVGRLWAAHIGTDQSRGVKKGSNRPTWRARSRK